MTFYLLAVLMTFFGALGAYFFKRGATAITGIVSMVTCPAVYLGGIFYVLGALFNVALLRYMDYSILYPMTAITYIWSMLLSWHLLGEHITKRKLAGVAAIFAGVCLLTL